MFNTQRKIAQYAIGLPRAFLVVALVVGCGKDADIGGPAGPSESVDAAADIDGAVVAEASSDALAAACDHYFTAQYGGKCQSPSYLPDQLTHLRPRFDAWCQSEYTQPGLVGAVDRLEACAAATEVQGNCYGPRPNACQLVRGAVHGNLANGAICGSGEQCQGGWCLAPSSDAAIPDSVCGTCSAAIPLGQPCNPADITQRFCAEGSICAANGSDAYSCQTRVFGDVGASCAAKPNECKPGIFCDKTLICSAFGDAGAPCIAAVQCRSPLVCSARTGGMCQSRAEEGASCPSGVDYCAFGLGCSGGHCVAVKWAQPGAPCDPFTTPCLIGQCPYSISTFQGVCPSKVIADSQPCDSGDDTATCDSLAGCSKGVCTLLASTCK